MFLIDPDRLSGPWRPSKHQPHPYLSYVVLPWVAMVTEPVEEGLIDAPRGLPGFAVGRQVLPTVPQDGVGEGGGGSWGEEDTRLEQTQTQSSAKGLFKPGLKFTSHADVELLHDDVVLEVRIPPEVKTDPVADFVIVEGLDLRERRRKA